MNKNVYNDMLNQMKKENDDKEKNCNVNNFQFRNQLTVPYDIPKIIDKVKNLKIQSNQYSLIKYIKTKESFNPILVKNYSNFSDRQLEKDNQLCKIILNNRKKDNIYKRIAEKKIKLKFSNYNNNLDRMKRDILCSARIINKYNNIKTNRELIKQTYEDFKRTYWKNGTIETVHFCIFCNWVARASAYLCCRYEKERTFAILWHRALLCGHSCVNDGCGYDSVKPGLFEQRADKLGQSAYACARYCDDCAGRCHLRERSVYEQDR